MYIYICASISTMSICIYIYYVICNLAPKRSLCSDIHIYIYIYGYIYIYIIYLCRPLYV